MGIRQKVKWLGATMREGTPSRWPVNIDTSAKTIVLHLTVLILAIFVSHILIALFHFSQNLLIKIGIILLLINYFYTTFTVDRYHSEIGSLISLVKKRSDKS